MTMSSVACCCCYLELVLRLEKDDERPFLELQKKIIKG
jgi:hypothetical protein